MKQKCLRTLILAVCFAFVAVLFPGCLYKEYTGPYSDLYTAAINSVLWTRGFAQGPDAPRNSEINIIEIDKYGRILYSYRETYYYSINVSFTALIVSQYTSDGYVYYYEDCNYIVREQAHPQIPQTFEPEAVEHLKEVNDWGKPVNSDKCIGKTIVKQKLRNDDTESAVKDRVISEYGLSDVKYYSIFTDYLTDDKNGNCIYYGVIRKNSEKEYNFFVAFVSAEGDIKLFTPTNLFDYNEELKTFKAENGWAS